MRAQLIVTSALAFALTGCGGGGNSGASEPSSATSATEAPASTHVTVVLTDAPPLNLLYNLGTGSCTTSLLATQSGVVNLTLKDASGDTVATMKLAKEGGTFIGSKCVWPETFSDVPASDYYSIEVTGGGGSWSAQAPSGKNLNVAIS